MKLPQLSFAPARIFRSDFVPEWLGIVLMFAIAGVWMAGIDFDVHIAWHDFALPLAAVIGIVGAHSMKGRAPGLIAEYFALTVFATVAFGFLSYLSMTTGRPFVDRDLLAADRALGFDWLAMFHWFAAHPWIKKAFEIVYGTLVYQGLYFGVLFGLMDRKQDLREMFWLVFVAGIFTCLGAALFPALGTFKAFGFNALGTFIPDMEKLHSGKHLSFVLTKMTGVVSFPSFHTTMALAYIYGFFRAGAIGWVIAALNIVMLVSIPIFGGHYLVDMLAGAVVMAGSLGIVKAWPSLLVTRGAEPVPVAKDAFAN